MMDPEQKIPFSSALDSLFMDETVSVPLLFRLSDMAEADFALFKERWPAVDDSRRRVIVRHLVDISEENYVVNFSPVFAFCFDDALPAVRVAALDGLWDQTNLRLVGPIITLLQQDESVEVQAAAASALAHFILMAEWGEIPRTMSPRIVEALLTAYDGVDTAVPVKRAALEALGAADHPRIATLIQEAYAGNDPDMRLSAVFAMGSSADERWIPDLLVAMRSEDANMRVEAARAAGSIGHEDALPTLAHLAVEEDLEIALTVVEALGNIGSEKAHKMLVQMGEDEHFARLHEAVAEALEEMDWIGGELEMLDFSGSDFDDEELIA